MDTQKLKDMLQRELDRLGKTRDELRLQAQLARAETRSELGRLENTWQQVQDELRRLGDSARAPAAELGGALRALVDELAEGYGRIKRELEDSHLNVLANRARAEYELGREQREPAAVSDALTEANLAAVHAPFMHLMASLASKIGAQADARAVFAPPVTRDGVTVIPVARVFAGFGAATGADAESGAPAGGGGGAFGATPLGFIEIDRRGARFKRLEGSVDSWASVAEFALRGASFWVQRLIGRRRKD
jgi:uncharacterized spore protein YtfJ